MTPDRERQIAPDTAATEAFLSERQLAARWQASPRTLQRWRAAGTGPRFLRIGALIRYPLADVEAFEAARRSMPDGSGGDEIR